MRRFRTAFVWIILALCIVVVPVSAQGQDIDFDNSVTIRDVEGLRLELIQQPQDPGSKFVRFDLIIKPQISSDRVQVRWDVSGVSEIVDGQTVQAYVVSPGQTYTSAVTIRPRAFGVTTIRAVVEAFQVDGTRVATATKTIGSYDTGEVFPPADGQSTANLMYFVRLLLTIVIGFVIVVAGGILALRFFQRWLNDSRS